MYLHVACYFLSRRMLCASFNLLPGLSCVCSPHGISGTLTEIMNEKCPVRGMWEALISLICPLHLNDKFLIVCLLFDLLIGLVLSFPFEQLRFLILFFLLDGYS